MNRLKKAPMCWGGWDGTFHEPVELKAACACGENMYCPLCSFGFGGMPCSCEREREEAEFKAWEMTSDEALEKWWS